MEHMIHTIIGAAIYMFLVFFGIGAAYAIRDLWRMWRDPVRDSDELNRHLCHRDMRRALGMDDD